MNMPYSLDHSRDFEYDEERPGRKQRGDARHKHYPRYARKKSPSGCSGICKRHNRRTFFG